MHPLRTLLTALLAATLLPPPAPAAASGPDRVAVAPDDAATARLDHPWVDVRDAEIVERGQRTAITGLMGNVRQIDANGNGWVVRAHGLYTVDSEGAATQIMRRRPTHGFVLDDQGNVAIQTEGTGKHERAIDAEHRIAWRTKRHRIRVFTLTPDQEWDWSARHYSFVNPALSPDGRHLVTYTRRGEEPDYPYAGSMVVRDIETGDALIDFRGHPNAEPFWVSNHRFIGQYFKNSDSLVAAQMRLTLAGAQRRVSPFRVRRVLAGAPQPIITARGAA